MYHTPSTRSVDTPFSMKPPVSPSVFRKRHPESAPSSTLKRDRPVLVGASNKSPQRTRESTSEGEFIPRVRAAPASPQFPDVKPSKERLFGNTDKMRSIRLDPGERQREAQAMDHVRRHFDATWTQRDGYDRVRAAASERVPDTNPVADGYWPAAPQSRFKHTDYSAGKDLLTQTAGSPSFSNEKDRFTTTNRASDLLDARVERQNLEQKESQQRAQQQLFQRKQETQRRAQDAVAQERSDREQAYFEGKRAAQAALHQQYLEGVARREAMQGRLQAIMK
eukprot:TRINITY_DN31779_c0_g1_i1.p1 TRINITY_DN31779_c0_g1~~TRINITY_DN31779_c0_g1_i1.p1  ORF type:complete len:280 (+),score=48.48 TRINITY_DN31779_c0_g1_i1:96-935(+)